MGLACSDRASSSQPPLLPLSFRTLLTEHTPRALPASAPEVLPGDEGVSGSLTATANWERRDSTEFNKGPSELWLRAQQLEILHVYFSLSHDEDKPFGGGTEHTNGGRRALLSEFPNLFI